MIAALVRIRDRLDRALVASQYARRGIEAVNDRLLTAYRVEARLAEYGAVTSWSTGR